MGAASAVDPVASERPAGTYLCWLGVFGNGLMLVVIAAFVILAMLSWSPWPDGEPDDQLLMFRIAWSAALAVSFVSWLVSAGFYKLRRAPADSDKLGVQLGLLLLIPVGVFLLFVSATIVMRG